MPSLQAPREGQLSRICHTFTTRLETLDRLLDKASAHWRERGRDPESLLAERLAEDMLPLAHQLAFSCEQPRKLAQFCAGRDEPTLDPTGWALGDAHAAVRETIDQLRALANEDESLLARDKHMQLQLGLSLTLSGADYIQEWLVPNFYFHFVTAYGILRHLGVPIGKADYMAHVAPYLQRD